MSFTVRRAEIKDADFIIDGNQKMAMETEGKALDPNIIGPGVRAVFENESLGFYLVAEKEGKVAGQLMITYEWSDWRNGLIFWIQSVYVKEEFRRQGVYSNLYNYLKTYVKERQGKAIRLYVEKENIGAQKTYEKLGMEHSHYFMYETEKV